MERDSNIITVLLLLLFQINIHSFIHSFINIHSFIHLLCARSMTPALYQELCNTGENEDIFQDLRLVRNRCRNNVIISHLNINSLRNKFHDLSDLFSDRLVDILFISETKLDSTFTQAQFDAPGYNSFRKDRNCHGGGLLAYIRSDLPARRSPDLELSRIESLIIEITINNRKWGIICAYRPPSMNNSIFIDDFTAGVDRLHVGPTF